MRIRTAVAALGAAALTCTVPQPAQAQTFADVHMEIDANCFGCGSDGPRRVKWWCYGPCVIDGNVCVTRCHYYGWSYGEEPSPCTVSGSESGFIEFPNGTQSFVLSRAAGAWVASFSDGSTGSGTYAVTDPVGNPCGGPATVTYVGAQAGA